MTTVYVTVFYNGGEYEDENHYNIFVGTSFEDAVAAGVDKIANHTPSSWEDPHCNIETWENGKQILEEIILPDGTTKKEYF